MDSEPNELTDILVICISTDGCDKLKENPNAERFSHCGIKQYLFPTIVHSLKQCSLTHDQYSKKGKDFWSNRIAQVRML